MTFEGQWLDSERHGSGLMKWPSGTTYDGEWRHNQFEGRGELHATSGEEPVRIYNGIWKGGEPTAQAVAIVWKLQGEDSEDEDKQPPPSESQATSGAPSSTTPGAAAKAKPSPSGSRAPSPTETEPKPPLALIAGEPMPTFIVRCKDADGATATYESGRMIAVTLQQLAQKETPDKKKGGKKTPEPEEPDAPPEILSSVVLGEVPTAAGEAVFEGIMLPAETVPNTYDGEYALAFSDTTKLDHPLLNFTPISAEAGTVVVRVEAGAEE